MTVSTVAIIGRPNVGKSSLFNRLLHRPTAVVAEQPGVTRDRNYGLCEWGGISFRLVDTGGLVPQADDAMEKLIYDQTEFAVNEADLVLFLVDTHVGTDPNDLAIARRLRRSQKQCLVVANKADSEALESTIYDFLKLGLGDPIPVSATVGRGIGDLLEMVVSKLPQPSPTTDEQTAIRVALVGRPNVGKSSFLNKLIGQDRSIVAPEAGTTRDSIDTPFELNSQLYVLVDTAGLRRKYKVHENIEFYTTLRAVRAIEGCDVAVILIDATDGPTTQDRRILELVMENRKAAVMVVNKWDLVQKRTGTAERHTRIIKDIIARYAHLPVIYVSALTGQRVTKVMELVTRVYKETNRRIQTSELNDLLQIVIKKKHPPARHGKLIKFNYVTQTDVAPPTFVFFLNHPKLVDKSYMAFLGNQIRAAFGFEGVPFRMKFRKK